MSLRVGYPANGVISCVEAIAELEKSASYKVVLLDLDIPRNQTALDCVRLLLSLRNKGRCRFGIVAITAYAMESERQQCFSIGVDDYLSKPFTAKELKAMLQKWCDGQIERVLRVS